MKALKRIDSTNDNPIWGEYSKEGYFYTVRNFKDNIPTLFLDVETIYTLGMNMTSSDCLELFESYELIEVDIKPKIK